MFKVHFFSISINMLIIIIIEQQSNSTKDNYGRLT